MADAQVMEAKSEWRRHERRVADERAEAAQLQIEQLASQWEAAEAEEAAGDAMTVEEAAANNMTAPTTIVASKK